MNQGNEQPGFWALIPASVRYDKELPPNAKLLYGEVTALSDKLGNCYAQNSYFSDLFGLSERSVTRLLSTLVDRGYLRVDVVRDTATQEVLERRIYAIYNTEGEPDWPVPYACRYLRNQRRTDEPPRPRAQGRPAAQQMTGWHMAIVDGEEVLVPDESG